MGAYNPKPSIGEVETGGPWGSLSRQPSSWGSLASQPNLPGEHQASESQIKKEETESTGEIQSWPLGSTHLYPHTYSSMHYAHMCKHTHTHIQNPPHTAYMHTHAYTHIHTHTHTHGMHYIPVQTPRSVNAALSPTASEVTDTWVSQEL